MARTGPLVAEDGQLAQTAAAASRMETFLRMAPRGLVASSARATAAGRVAGMSLTHPNTHDVVFWLALTGVSQAHALRLAAARRCRWR